MMTEQNKLLVRRLVEEAVNPGSLGVLDEVAAGNLDRMRQLGLSR